MPRQPFREVIMDDSTQTIEVLGLSTNDTALTNLVFEMQAVGIRARCQTAYETYTPDQIAEHFAEIGYRAEAGLSRISHISFTSQCY
jgi:hypothetical protein